MKKLIALAALAGLAACGDNEAEETATVDPATTSAEPAGTSAMADGTTLTPGSYTITHSDGMSYTVDANEVGVYTADVNGTEQRGTWTSEGSQTCFDPAGDNASEPTMCWTLSAPAADGTITATGQDGETATVVSNDA